MPVSDGALRELHESSEALVDLAELVRCVLQSGNHPVFRARRGPWHVSRVKVGFHIGLPVFVRDAFSDKIVGVGHGVNSSAPALRLSKI